MTNSPNSGNAPQSNRSNRRLRLILSRSGIAAGIILLVGLAGGSWWVWTFVNQRLAPIVQDNLTKTLKRPVQLGKVEGFWLNGLRFGNSGVPAIPTDPDSAQVAAVDVGFNPLDVVLTRTLKLDITLVNPNLYLEQDKEGRWITISLETKQEPGGLKTEVQTVRVQNADAVLLPFPKPGNQPRPLKFAQINGAGQISEQGKRIRFQLAGREELLFASSNPSSNLQPATTPQPATVGGSFQIEGDSSQTTKETSLRVQGQNLVAVNISRLIKLPNLDLQAGFLDANLGVQLNGAQPTSFDGTAGLKEVTVRIPQLPKLLDRVNGTLVFKGTQIGLDNVSALYGKIPATAAGVFDTKAGFNLKATTAPITLKTVLDTFDVKQPVAAVGEVKADLQLTGTPDKPVVAGTVVNTKLTRVDKLNIKTLSANFGLVGSTLSIKGFQAKPAVGGQVAGSGEITLGAKGGGVIDFQAQNLPGDAIAQIYGINLSSPVNLRVGRISAKGQIFGPFNNIQTVVRWNAPAATYPATGALAIQPSGQISLRDTNIQVAGGQVTGTGVIKAGTWQASVQASGIQGKNLEPLINRQLPPQLQGAISGRFNLSGNLDSLQPETIRATGSAALNVAGGTVKASNVNLEAGRFTADVTAAGVQLGRLLPQAPPGLRSPIDGTFKVAGSLDKSDPSGIKAKASGNLNVAGGTVTVSSINLQDNLFIASVQAKGVEVGSLAPQVPPGVRSGRLNGNFDLAGSLDNLQLAAIQGKGSGSLQVGAGTVTASNINLQSGRFIASVQAQGVEVAKLAPQVPPQVRGRLNGNFDVAGSLDNLTPAAIQAKGAGSLNVGGATITASDLTLNAGSFVASVQASGVNLGSLSPLVPPQLRGGQLNGNFDVAGNLNNLQPATIQARGSGSVNVGSGIVRASNVNLNAGRFAASVSAEEVDLGFFGPQVPPPLRGGRLNGAFDLAGNLAGISNLNSAFKTLSQINARGSGSIQLPQGTVTASNFNLESGRFAANVSAQEVDLGFLGPPVSSQLKGGRLNGNFELAGNLNKLAQTGDLVSVLTALDGRGSGSIQLPQGTVSAANINLESGRFAANVSAQEVDLAFLGPQVPPQVRGGRLNGNFDLRGNLPKLAQARDLGSLLTAIESDNGSGSIKLNQGTVTAANIKLQSGQFKASVKADAIALSPFNPQLRGLLTGELNLSGNLAALTPSAIQASGNLSFSEGISSIEQPLTTAFSWDGKNLQIQRASGPGLEASGVVALARVNGPGIPEVRSFDLNVQAQGLNLQKLPIAPPNNIQVAGLLDFTGRLQGTLSEPTVIGDTLRVRNFAVSGLAFEPELTGRVQVEPGRGVNLQLAGIQDRIQLALSPFPPSGGRLGNGSFLLNIAQPNRPANNPGERIIASGSIQGDAVKVEAQSLPLATIKSLAPTTVLANLPGGIGQQPVSGSLSGNFDITLGKGGLTSLPERVVATDVAIANPTLGNIKGNLIGIDSISYAGGNLKVTGAQFQQGETKYALSGSLNQNPNSRPQFEGQVKVAQGKVQDIVTVASLFGINDIQDLSRGFGQPPAYGTAADLQVQPRGLPDQPLQTQLRRFSEIEALRQRQQSQRDQNPIPELRDLIGTFNASVSVAGSLNPGFKPNLDTISSNFDFRGNDWKWDRYTASTVTAKGSFQNGILTLLPLRIESDKTLIAFSGNLGGEQQTGQLRVQNVPVDFLQQFVDLPVDISGDLNATATLAGSIKNPLARGEVTLTEGNLNQTPIKSGLGSFSYANARLNFGSTVEVATAGLPTEGSTQSSNLQPSTPISINGSIPYKLPFASVGPDNNQFSVNVNVANEGLAVLTLLSRRQVTWVNGNGQVQLAVQGTLDPENSKIQQLKATGTASVDNATIKAQALPEPLTGVTSTVVFDFDRIQVQSLQAKYGNGLITASGVLPISTPVPTDNPLSVNIGELAINLKGLYSGGVRGNVQITNTALAPKIGGEVRLFNGQVQVQPERSNSGGSSGGTGGNAIANDTIAFNNLELILDKGVQVTLPPILNFLASGQLNVNGTLDEIQPTGTINLQRGQVNIFTTQFRLDRGYPQRAEFVKGQGLDPNLDVRLVASVGEVTRSRLPTNTASSEISEDISATNLGTLGTVRIQARVLGPASKLTESLQLNSNPPRSESEIVALLGGSFVQTLGRGDSTLGLANFAGSAILGNVQNVIGDALGLSEFRLFPTLSNNTQKSGAATSTLGLAAEVGIDINRRLSASASKVLTTDQSPQFGLRYRLNDNILLRGSTNLSDDNRAVVEYEKRF